MRWPRGRHRSDTAASSGAHLSLLDGWLIVELLLLGSVGGFLAGLLGIGGGMILVPFTSWILSSRGVEPELALKMAVATSMAMILFTSISSVRAHHQRGTVRWDLVRGLAPGARLNSDGSLDPTFSPPSLNPSSGFYGGGFVATNGSVLVTENVKDFPMTELEMHGLS